ncbi:Crp/Fnr family transcriptional regulator [Pseudomonas sp. NPDC087614]|uniref:Crp/Fnr family transcriptional regulator n=1 Tax=Pseudomonas sp. NPDC087614 TaxID=3364442 RepID=UPI00381208C8
MSELPNPQQNHLLAALPVEIRHRLLPQLELVSFPQGKVLYESGDVLRYVYFPTDSIISLLYVMENGAAADISVVGNEGLIGVALFMGGESTSSRAVVQSAGYAFRLRGQLLKDEFNRHGEMLRLMLRYTQALITQMAQTAVCNRHHSIDQRLCRWLLLSLDRLPGNQLVMTQELIGNMLGVRREGITEAARKLQKLGVIEYCRGLITVLDRPQLEELSCECYAVVKHETDRLLPCAQPEHLRRPVCHALTAHVH